MLAEQCLDTRADLLQDEIAGVMAERVVDLFEAVEVHDEQRERRRDTSSRPQALLEAVEKERAVG